MITEREHKALCRGMEGKVYQTYDRLRRRMAFAEKYVQQHFRDCAVVEFGCNAGFYSTIIAPVAASYLGVDNCERYHQQSLVLKSNLPDDEHYDHVGFMQRTVKGFIRDLQKAEQHQEGQSGYFYDACFMSFVLYHLSQKEVELLKWYLPRYAKVVIVQTRLRKRQQWRYHNTYRFWELPNVERFLEGLGYVVESHMGPDGAFVDTVGILREEGCDGAEDSGESSATVERVEEVVGEAAPPPAAAQGGEPVCARDEIHGSRTDGEGVDPGVGRLGDGLGESDELSVVRRPEGDGGVEGCLGEGGEQECADSAGEAEGVADNDRHEGHAPQRRVRAARKQRPAGVE